jgi:hypothetical protein
VRKDTFFPLGAATELPGPLLESIPSVPHSQSFFSGYPFSVFQLRGILPPEATRIEKSIPRLGHFLVDQPIADENVSQEAMILVPFVSLLHFQSYGFILDPGDGKFPGLLSPGFLPHLLALRNLGSINLPQTYMLLPTLDPDQECVPVKNFDHSALEGLGRCQRREYQEKKKKKEENPIGIHHDGTKTNCPWPLGPRERWKSGMAKMSFP